MAYVLNGVTVERSDRSMRPREPAPPSRKQVLSSPMMATRQLRPRETPPGGPMGYFGTAGLGMSAADNAAARAAQSGSVPTILQKPGAVADQWLAQIAAHKGQQAQLEALLKQIGVALKTCQANATMAARAGKTAQASALQASCLQIQKDADACINAIKACAAKAQDAAGGAIATGATKTQVVAAANAGTAAGATLKLPNVSAPNVTMHTDVMPGGGVPVSLPTVYQGVTNNPLAIETNHPSIGPDGTVTVGPDATDGNGNPLPSAPAEHGGVGIAVIGGLAILGYLMMKGK